MMLGRRSFLFGLGASIVAPAVVRASSLMPISSAKLFPVEIIGAIKPVAGPIPPGWIECDGRALCRSSHSDLYEIIGNKYGNNLRGFCLPDLSMQAQIERAKGNIVGRFIIYGGTQQINHRASIDGITGFKPPAGGKYHGKLESI